MQHTCNTTFGTTSRPRWRYFGILVIAGPWVAENRALAPAAENNECHGNKENDKSGERDDSGHDG
jgi:hypothetical protein